ncbi:MAG: hypothetical protein H6843_10725 [Rhodospirillaceae bacterium]|nr:hypothetical protein [Rhodospirillaceae bacterium]
MLGQWAVDSSPLIGVVIVITGLVIGRQYADHGRIVWPRLARIMAVAILVGVCANLAVHALRYWLGW